MKSQTALKGSPSKQQTIERHYFEMFRKAYPLPSGRIDYDDKPDVILNGTQKLGIEITNLYVTDGSCPASEQVQRVRRKAVVSKAQQLYEQATGNNFPLSASRRCDLAPRPFTSPTRSFYRHGSTTSHVERVNTGPGAIQPATLRQRPPPTPNLCPFKRRQLPQCSNSTNSSAVGMTKEI